MRKCTMVAVAVAATLVSCSTSDDGEVGVFGISYSAGKLRLTNSSSDAYYYVALGQKFLAQASWAVACTPDNIVEPGRLKSIPIDSIGKAADDSVLVVNYWKKEVGSIPCAANLQSGAVRFR